MSSQVEALLSRAEVLAIAKISPSKLHADIAEFTFPAPVKIGTRSFFIAAEVMAWLDKRVAERDAEVERKKIAKAASQKSSDGKVARKRTEEAALFDSSVAEVRGENV